MTTTKLLAKGCVVVLAPIELLDDRVAKWALYVACKVYCQLWPRAVVLGPELENSSKGRPLFCSLSDSFH